jgi:large subunit ribosomal protein L13
MNLFMISIKRKTHTIDAAGVALGKLATHVAVVLRGKDKPDFVKHIDAGDFVVVKNFKDVKITGKKLEQEKYYHYTGYMGGLKEKTMGELMEEKPAEVLRRAVMRMLPKNKLRDRMIKRLTVKN